MKTKMAFENAGYDIKDYKMYRKQENGENFVVLAHNKKSGMWATWECTNGNDFYWGHYFDSYIEARKDYYTRLASKYDLPWEG